MDFESAIGGFEIHAPNRPGRAKRDPGGLILKGLDGTFVIWRQSSMKWGYINEGGTSSGHPPRGPAKLNARSAVSLAGPRGGEGGQDWSLT